MVGALALPRPFPPDIGKELRGVLAKIVQQPGQRRSPGGAEGSSELRSEPRDLQKVTRKRLPAALRLSGQ